MNNSSLYPILDRSTLSASIVPPDPSDQRAFFDQGCVILIDKPATWTSFDAVNKIRRITKAKRVGHSGTLDPFATGLLIVVTGKATKSVTEFQDQAKTYDTVFEFGKETDTLDTDGHTTRTVDRVPSKLEVETALDGFRGVIQQVPPAYSALKVGGTPSYRLARKGKASPLAARAVEVLRFDLVEFTTSHARFMITCSKGTYVRSLARDLGAATGSAAFVRELRRIAIGNYDVTAALSIDEFENLICQRTSGARHS